jgi:hypothetical protein
MISLLVLSNQVKGQITKHLELTLLLHMAQHGGKGAVIIKHCDHQIRLTLAQVSVYWVIVLIGI